MAEQDRDVYDKGSPSNVAASVPANTKVRMSSSPGTPGITGAIKDAVEGLKSYMGAGRRSISGSIGEQSQGDAISGVEANHSTTVSTNAGRNNQSTDAQNRY
jgi:hypothetical protein